MRKNPTLVLVALLLVGGCSDDSSQQSPKPDGRLVDLGQNDLGPQPDASPVADQGPRPDGPGAQADGPVAQGPLDDEFSGTSLDPAWKSLNATIFTHAVASGELTMTPTAWSMWYEGDQGPGLYKLIKGNFHVSTRVRVRQASAPSKPPASDYQFGGLMARDPASDGPKGENYVFIVVGYRGDYLATEAKTTVNDSSTITAPSWTSGDSELRLCRVGTTYRVYRRAIGAKSWEEIKSYTRGDLPQTLQVALVAYALADTPNVLARFDYYRVSTQVTSAADCKAN